MKRVAAMLDVSARTVWRLVEQGRLPAPQRLTGNTVRWAVEDVEDFLYRVKTGQYSEDKEITKEPPEEPESTEPKRRK